MVIQSKRLFTKVKNKMDYLAGVIGFLGYEGLRIYQCLNERRAIVPSKNWPQYLISILLIIPFSSCVAHAVSSGNFGLAIYIGFSVPTNAKMILKNRSKAFHVEDFRLLGAEKHLEKKASNPLRRISDAVQDYFSS